MAKYLERDSRFPKQQAEIITNTKFKTAPKVKINRAEYSSTLEAMFINGELLMLTTVRSILQNCDTISREELVADLIELESAVKNQVNKNGLLQRKGRFTKTSYIEDFYKENTKTKTVGV